MTDLAIIEAGAHDPLPALLASLQLEFEGAADLPMARDIVAREAVDFHWAARIEAVRLGAVERFEEEAEPLDCWVAIGVLDSRWFVAKLLVDGAGGPRELLEVQRFEGPWDAYTAFDG